MGGEGGGGGGDKRGLGTGAGLGGSWSVGCTTQLALALLLSSNNVLHPARLLRAGTGSGSLTHSLARAVAPTGHVHTFDFHALRAQV